MRSSLRGLLLAGAAVAIPATVNAVIASRVPSLEQPLPGDIGYYDWVHGRVAYYRMGQGAPLLLVHNPNAGGSAWEWRNVFPDLAEQFTVYAIDLLGFGLSDKPNITYAGSMCAELVHDFLQDVIGERASAIGSALSASYLVNVAVRRPESLHRLVLVNPTGGTMRMPVGSDQVAYHALRAPVIGTSIYNGLVSRANIIRELTEHEYDDPGLVSPDIVDHYYIAAHQPGSQYAAAAFISGQLNLPMRIPFASLTQPTQLLWGRQAYYTPVAEADDLLFRYPQARLEVIDDCGMLPHVEKAGEFLRISRSFLSEVSGEDMAA